MLWRKRIEFFILGLQDVGLAWLEMVLLRLFDSQTLASSFSSSSYQMFDLVPDTLGLKASRQQGSHQAKPKEAREP